jgi:hypothetical protein
MNQIKFIKALIALSVVLELFILFTIFDIAQKKSIGGDTVTFEQNTPIDGQNLAKGTYILTQEGFVRINNYWIFKAKILTITIPLLMFIISLVILNNYNKKKNSDVGHISNVNTQENEDTIPEKTKDSGIIKATLSTNITEQIVENIVQKLRDHKPLKALCWVVLFGDRPLAANLEGECILCFSNKSKSEYFMSKYQKNFYCTRPLTSLSIGNIDELWALLNNKSNDPDYETPYGLLINFNYDGQQYHKYTKTDLKKIGLKGLEKGLRVVL